jgi:hypothetical protein
MNPNLILLIWIKSWSFYYMDSELILVVIWIPSWSCFTRISSWSLLLRSLVDLIHLHGSQDDPFTHMDTKLIPLFIILIPSFILSFMFFSHSYLCFCTINLVKKGKISSLIFYLCFLYIKKKLGKIWNYQNSYKICF